MTKERYYLLDNAKIALILLIIFGHLIELNIGKSITYKAIYLTIYSFHIPMFVFISGVLSKGQISSAYIKRNISGLIIPLLVFQVLYEILELMVHGSLSAHTTNLQPYWILWYLISLFTWRLMLSAFIALRYPIFLSTLIAIIAGYSSCTGYYLGISRTLTFFPIFLVGYYFGPDLFNKLKFRGSNILFMTVLASVFFVFVFNHDINHRWMYGSYAYPNLGHKEWYAGIYRLALYSISLAVGLSFVGLLPFGQKSISRFGKNTLFIYLWHGVYVKLLMWNGVLKYIYSLNEAFSLILLAFISSAIFLLISSDIVARFTNRYLFRPVAKLLISLKS